MPMNTMKPTALLISALLVGGLAQAQDAIAPEAAKAASELAATTCSVCHGPAGRNSSPIFPNLAGQSALYLETQLKAFRDQTRADPDAQAYMWGMASQLKDEQIAAIAAHYAAQAPAEGHRGDAKLVEKGRVIFEQGVPAKGIPACGSCHGAKAQGNGPFPRLAGQHSGYLIKQILVIQNALRAAPVMHGVIKDLTRDQMLQVAAYLESIGPS